MKSQSANVARSEWSKFIRRTAIGLCSLTILYVLFTWDYYLSKYLFEKLCNDDEQIGLFVYGHVQLADQYLMPFPADKEVRDLDYRFILSDNLMINRETFDRDYLYEPYKYVQFSAAGPISLDVTMVTRRSDGELLGKAVSAKNSMGWLNRATSIAGISGDECPSGRDENNFANFNKSHKQLIKQIFYRSE